MGVRRTRRKRAKIGHLALVGAFLIGLLCGYGLSMIPLEGKTALSEEELLEWAGPTGRVINILAVASGSQPLGVVCTLAVKVAPGHGGLYMDIDPTLVGFDFQEASRVAARVAAKKVGLEVAEDGVGIKGVDIFFRVAGPGKEITVEAIDGPSAGAATTIALIAALENRQIKPDVVITGTIQPDGTIGQVGGVFYKAEAAAAHGAKLMLVPKGQSKVVMYEQVTRRIGWFTWTTYVPEVVDLNEWSENQGWGLEIREVENIDEVMELMLESTTPP